MILAKRGECPSVLVRYYVSENNTDKNIPSGENYGKKKVSPIIKISDLLLIPILIIQK
jgi:hypothetical protein